MGENNKEKDIEKRPRLRNSLKIRVYSSCKTQSQQTPVFDQRPDGAGILPSRGARFNTSDSAAFRLIKPCIHAHVR